MADVEVTMNTTTNECDGTKDYDVHYDQQQDQRKTPRKNTKYTINPNSNYEDSSKESNENGLDILIPLAILDFFNQMTHGEIVNLRGSTESVSSREAEDGIQIKACKGEELILTLHGTFLRGIVNGTESSPTLTDDLIHKIHKIKLDSQIIQSETHTKRRRRKCRFRDATNGDFITNVQPPKKGRRGRKPKLRKSNAKGKYGKSKDILRPKELGQSEDPESATDDTKFTSHSDQVVDSDDANEHERLSPEDGNDFSDWEATDKKFKKKKGGHLKIETGIVQNSPNHTEENQFVDDMDTDCKKGQSSDRLINKTMYNLNRKVAKGMKYDVTDEGQTCIICGEVTKPKWNLMVHLKRFHLMERKEYHDLLLSSADERMTKLEQLRSLKAKPDKVHAPKMAGTLSCSYCGQDMLGIRNMKRHLLLLHRRETDLKDKIAFFTKEYAKLIHKNRMVASRKENLRNIGYPCKYCGIVLSMSCTRSRHQMYSCSQNPNKKKRVHCNYCGSAFIKREAMERHLKLHAAHDFKYVCDVCGKECKTKALMYEHKLKDHSGKPARFTCMVCNKGFHYKDQLKKHYVTHSDLKEVMCDLCGKMFKTAANVQKHKKHVHERRFPFQCDLCGHGVSKRSYLKTHKCGRVRRPKLESQDLSKETEIPTTSDDMPFTNNNMVYNGNSNVAGEEILYTSNYTSDRGQLQDQIVQVAEKDVSAPQYLPATGNLPSIEEHCYTSTNIQPSQYVSVNQADQTQYVMHTLQPHPVEVTSEYQTTAQYGGHLDNNMPVGMYPIYNVVPTPVPQASIPPISASSYMAQMLPVPRTVLTSEGTAATHSQPDELAAASHDMVSPSTTSSHQPSTKQSPAVMYL